MCWRFSKLLAVALAATACSACRVFDDGPLLEPRLTEVDTTRITQDLRENGGPVFVHTTEFPTPEVVTDLEEAGLAAPEGRDRPVTFPNLELTVVWGVIEPGGVHRIAAKEYVTMIEPSTDPDGIFPAGDR